MTSKIRKFDISIGFVLILSVLFFFDSEQLLFPALCAFTLHELGHVLAIRLCGGAIECVRLRVFGARIVLKQRPILSYKQDMIIAAAGPVTGLITALVSSYAAGVFNINALFTFSGLNLVLSVVNLVPIYPLDGGRIVSALLLLLFELETANRITFIISVFFTALIMLFCTAVTKLSGFSLTLVIFTAFIVLSMCVTD